MTRGGDSIGEGVARVEGVAREAIAWEGYDEGRSIVWERVWLV